MKYVIMTLFLFFLPFLGNFPCIDFSFLKCYQCENGNVALFCIMLVIIIVVISDRDNYFFLRPYC